MTVGALVKRSFITKEVLFQSFTFAVKIVYPYILSIYKTVLLSLEGKFWATIIHSVPAGTRNTDLKSSIKVKPTMGFSIWRNIKWNGKSILMNRTQVQIPEYFAWRTERKLEREMENMADVPTKFFVSEQTFYFWCHDWKRMATTDIGIFERWLLKTQVHKVNGWILGPKKNMVLYIHNLFLCGWKKLFSNTSELSVLKLIF